ncbi:MAG: S8 family serine peptidase [Planctomycetia bacterium]|nr:S8 family serine peptidase [Planctomycetia bacterium]
MGLVSHLVSWLRRPAETPLRQPRKRLHFEVLEERTLLDAATPGLLLETDPNGLQYDATTLLVAFQDGAVPAEILPAGASLGDALTIVPGLYEIDLDGSLTVMQTIDVLSGNPFVRYTEPNYLIQPEFIPNDPLFGFKWGLHNTGQDIPGFGPGTPDADIDAPEAWDLINSGGGGGSGGGAGGGGPGGFLIPPGSGGGTPTSRVVVAILDTGVDWTHQDLFDNIWRNNPEIFGFPGFDDDGNGFIDDLIGWDFGDNDNNPQDADIHGTHVAGIVGAVHNNGIGVSGVAPDVQIMPLKIFGGRPFISAAIGGIGYAVRMGARISNSSWRTPGPPLGAFSASLFDAVSRARDAGLIFVASAGNTTEDNDVIDHYPSDFELDNVVAVAATDKFDDLAFFSNFGATTVDLGAPGVEVLSTIPGNDYTFLDGTSMASPHVAGALAVVWQQNPSLSYIQVINRVLSTVDPLPSLNGITVTGGRLNLFNAVATTPAGITINDVTVVEGDIGTVNAVFTVTLTRASTSFVSVRYATEDVTAQAGSDYFATSGTVTFAPGETTKTVVVTIISDLTQEPNETFHVNLSVPVGAQITDFIGVGTILNDDGFLMGPEGFGDFGSSPSGSFDGFSPLGGRRRR